MSVFLIMHHSKWKISQFPNQIDSWSFPYMNILCLSHEDTYVILFGGRLIVLSWQCVFEHKDNVEECIILWSETWFSIRWGLCQRPTFCHRKISPQNLSFGWLSLPDPSSRLLAVANNIKAQSKMYSLQSCSWIFWAYALLCCLSVCPVSCSCVP